MIYTTILHPVRKQFGISCNDYCIADMIYNLSANPAAPILGWCNASRQTLADAMGLARKSVIEIINKLEGKGLIERQQLTDYLRTTSLWYDSVTGCKERLQGVTKGDSNKRLQGVTKGDTRCEERLQEGVTKGDTIIKEDNKRDNTSSRTASENLKNSNFGETQKKQNPNPVAAAPSPEQVFDYLLSSDSAKTHAKQKLRLQTDEEYAEVVTHFVGYNSVELKPTLAENYKHFFKTISSWAGVNLAKSTTSHEQSSHSARKPSGKYQGSTGSSRKVKPQIDLAAARNRRGSSGGGQVDRGGGFTDYEVV